MLRERTRTNAYQLSASSLLTRPAWDQRGGKGAKAMARCVSKRASLVLGQAERGRGHTVGDVPAIWHRCCCSVLGSRRSWALRGCLGYICTPRAPWQGPREQ